MIATNTRLKRTQVLVKRFPFTSDNLGRTLIPIANGKINPIPISKRMSATGITNWSGRRSAAKRRRISGVVSRQPIVDVAVSAIESA